MSLKRKIKKVPCYYCKKEHFIHYMVYIEDLNVFACSKCVDTEYFYCLYCLKAMDKREKILQKDICFDCYNKINSTKRLKCLDKERDYEQREE